jgi:hypothetical protein
MIGRLAGLHEPGHYPRATASTLQRVDGSESGVPLSAPAGEAGVPGWLEGLPRETMAAMLEAGREALEWRRILAKTGDNVVAIVLRHQGAFHVLDHYPKGDVFDPESHGQWYYHAHDKGERPGEHGHFHTFIRGGGMPEGIGPAPLADYVPKAERHDIVCHLIAISMDGSGWPVGLFTTNRWVTGETWFRAHDVCALLDRFEMRMNKPSWPVNRWLSVMLRLFRPQIEELLMQRDERVRAFGREHSDSPNVYEDRRLEVTSQLAVSVEAQVRALEVALKRS